MVADFMRKKATKKEIQTKLHHLQPNFGQAMQITHISFVAQANIVLNWYIPKKLKMISKRKRTMLATIAIATQTTLRID